MRQQTTMIEFFGMPGSGKSTLSKELETKLEQRGEVCINFSQVYDPIFRTGNMFMLIKKYIFLAWFISLNIRLIIDILVLVINIRPLNITTIIYAMKLIIVFFRMNRVIKLTRKSNYDFIIFDQAAAQSVWSCLLTGRVSSEEHLNRIIHRIYNKLMLSVIYLELDIDLAVERIHLRTTCDSRFDKIEKSKAKLWLLKYEPFLKIIFNKLIYNHVNTIMLNSSYDLEKNIGLITEFLLENNYKKCKEGNKNIF